MAAPHVLALPLRHREDGPAVEYVGGAKEWWVRGELHREDGPALEYSDGSRQWYFNGVRHREDGPAVECANGTKNWYLRGKRHREDGPAIESADGSKVWCIRGEYHRLDGPAIESVDGTQPRLHWYFEGHWLTEKQHSRIREWIERAEKARAAKAHRIKWFILDRLLPKLCSPHSAAFLKRFHADWDAASAL